MGETSANPPNAGTPAIRRPPGPEPEGPVKGTGLCLSGGGYRAMLFHVGSLWRLNQAGYLPKLDLVSSVSGGSITAGVLALGWERLSFVNGVASNFEAVVADPLRAAARRTVDVWAVLSGLLVPGTTINDRLARSYRKLFGDATLADLPVHPEFVFDATSLQSGDLWRFSAPVEGDWRVGSQVAPRTGLAQVVAASSAFPPFLSPARFSFPAGALTGGGDSTVAREPFTRRAVLSDGGVYDNLGLEAVWRRNHEVLISDAGGHMKDSERPLAFWPIQFYRVLSVIDNQVRDLRKRQAVLSFIDQRRDGAYWGIRSHVRDFGLPDPIVDPSDAAVQTLAGFPTRLARVQKAEQERLINWGYVMCDTAMRAHFDRSQPPGSLPFPDALLDSSG